MSDKRDLDSDSVLEPPSKRVKAVSDGSLDDSITIDTPENAAASAMPTSQPSESSTSAVAPPDTSDMQTADTGGPSTVTKQEGKRKNREQKNAGRRRREARPEGEGEQGPKAPRFPKRQCALLLGFCGSNYRGMQFQNVPAGHTEQKTIEGTLFDALVRAGAVSKDNANDPVKVNFARAARTDAGVHAAGNVVTLKMITEIPGEGSMLDRINAELPPEIRVWDFMRVQNSFDARTNCDSRKYTYLFPSYLLIPPKPGSGLHSTLNRHSPSSSPDDAFWTDLTLESTTPDQDLLRKRAWRASPAHIERLRTVSKKLEGTHNFHNFTVTREPKDRTNQRYIKSVQIEEPAVYGETEWIGVLFHGQSFMLHQIRKMMFALIMTCRTNTPDSVIDAFYPVNTCVVIPKMPALGLLLEYPIFDSYNTRMAVINEKLEPSHPEYRPPFNFEAYAETMAAFKQKYIYDNMRGVEDRKGLFDAWVRAVDSYAGDDLLYLNTSGTIPPEAVLNKGVTRRNPFKERKQFDKTSFSADDDEKIVLDGDEVDDMARAEEAKLAEAEG